MMIGGVLIAQRTQNAHENKGRFDKEGRRYYVYLNSDDEVIGRLYTKSMTVNEILNRNDEKIGEIKSGLGIKINDRNGNPIGSVKSVKSKLSSAVGLFVKTSNKWQISISSSVEDEDAELIKAAAILFSGLVNAGFLMK